MRGFFFAFDLALALFFLSVILSGQGDLHVSQSVSTNLETKAFGQDVLNTMEKTGFLRQVSQSGSSSDVEDYLEEVLPPALAANFSLTVYRYSGGPDFTVHRSLSGATGVVNRPFTATRRVMLVPRSGNDDYILVALWVGFR